MAGDLIANDGQIRERLRHCERSHLCRPLRGLADLETFMVVGLTLGYTLAARFAGYVNPAAAFAQSRADGLPVVQGIGRATIRNPRYGVSTSGLKFSRYGM